MIGHMVQTKNKMEGSAAMMWPLENSLVNKTRISGLDLTGSTPLSNILIPTLAGKYSAGPFTTFVLTGSSAVKAKISENSTLGFTIQFDIYVSTLTSQPVVIGYTDNGRYEAGIQLLNTGALRWFIGGIYTDSGAGEITTGQWYRLTYQLTSSASNYTKRIWVNGRRVVNESAAADQRLFNCVNFRIGAYTLGGAALDGYLKNIIYTNKIIGPMEV